jgi:hypothetical protein
VDPARCWWWTITTTQCVSCPRPARSAPSRATPEGARIRRDCPAQARKVPSASTKRPSGLPRPGAAKVDAAASRAGGRARLAADGHGLGASFADGLRRRAGRGRALQRAAQRSVVVTANGEIVMTDLGNHAVRVVTAARCAHWPALAGNGKRGFVDGQGAAARFNYPIGLAVDVDGSIQVTDCGNHVVGRVTMAGAVSTVAGNGQKRYGDEAARLIAPAPW